MLDVVQARHRMIESQLRRRGIHDDAVLRAMEDVPRDRFVEPGSEEFAYEDSPLPIAEGQTISQPYIVALMLQQAAIAPDDIVLEVGTGSGYAAAVMSRIASHVYSIERHATLADRASRRFRDLGYDNIDVKVGDGTRGWAEAGPFGAILVAAAGSSIPVALTEQLDIGGRLVIPIGEGDDQRLLKVTRTSATTFEEEDLGAVIFVPLVPGKGEPTEPSGQQRFPSDETLPLTQLIAARAEALPDIDDPAFGKAFDRFGNRRVVLLGEASHGTSEFYRARDAITRTLVEAHGFNIVAVEADWPDAAAIDRYARDRPPGRGQVAEAPFQRFPRWMWRNREFLAFVEWLRRRNAGVEARAKAGFYGLDLYNLSASISAVLGYLDMIDPSAAAVARERYGCLTPWQNEPATYGRAVLTAKYKGCEDQVVAQCRDLLSRSLDLSADGSDEFLDATQSARLVAAAERYYRVMYYGGPAAWNLRDDHMFDTLANVLKAKGPTSKAVVWAHNSHIGDARQTDMSTYRDEINLGQRCRERFDGDAALIGFGTHSGQVAAASDWDGEMEIKRVRPALPNSYEKSFHDSGITRHLLDFSRDEELKQRLATPQLERYIGVIYRPETERGSHYSEASISEQYDAFAWFDQTSPVSALDSAGAGSNLSDTFPFGL